MIEVKITHERALELISDGAQMITYGGRLAFIFTGPGVQVAEIAYGIKLPSDKGDLTDQSPWDIAILTPEDLEPYPS
jgi:hypothetical protein